MKTELHKAQERGESKLNWLHSRFSFSFANYYNPKRMGFGKLLVLNDDIIEPKTGFASHSHENMEIITIVLKGALEHQDSTNVHEIIKAGEIQVMSAGSGITHSEYNPSQKEKVELLQIWILPQKKNLKPRHETRGYKLVPNKLTLVVTGEKNKDALYINQTAKILMGSFDTQKDLTIDIEKGRGVFLFMIEGSATIDNQKLQKRDALAIQDTTKILIQAQKNSTLLLLEVPL